MGDGFTMRAMILNGWPVLSVLVVMSILSVTVIVDRLVVFMRIKISTEIFISRILDILDKHGRNEAIQFCEQFKKPIAVVVATILRQEGNREALERASQHALQSEINQLECYVPILGTIASTAPFVGLFGTVIGIIRAFQDIATSAGSGPEVVAAGIAEALITTAVGLFVAIPATMFYNYFIRHTQTVAQYIDVAVYDVIERLAGRSK
jgi:biopolymer transport protein ExbB